MGTLGLASPKEGLPSFKMSLSLASQASPLKLESDSWVQAVPASPWTHKFMFTALVCMSELKFGAKNDHYQFEKVVCVVWILWP